MDAVGATDGDRVLVLEGPALDGGKQRVHVSEQNVGCPDELDVETGVEHIRGSHPLVDETGVRADDFRQMGQEGDDVVLGLALDLVDPVDVESGRAALVPDGFGGLFRDHAQFGKRVAGMRLDFEPDAEFGFRRPDSDHVRSRVARDHRASSFSEFLAAVYQTPRDPSMERRDLLPFAFDRRGRVVPGGGERERQAPGKQKHRALDHENIGGTRAGHEHFHGAVDRQDFVVRCRIIAAELQEMEQGGHADGSGDQAEEHGGEACALLRSEPGEKGGQDPGEQGAGKRAEGEQDNDVDRPGGHALVGQGKLDRDETGDQQ